MEGLLSTGPTPSSLTITTTLNAFHYSVLDPYYSSKICNIFIRSKYVFLNYFIKLCFITIQYKKQYFFFVWPIIFTAGTVSYVSYTLNLITIFFFFYRIFQIYPSNTKCMLFPLKIITTPSDFLSLSILITVSFFLVIFVSYASSQIQDFFVI